MRPGGAMMLGGFGGLFIMALEVFVVSLIDFDTNAPTFAMVAFAFGALFGKGYGIHEERSE